MAGSLFVFSTCHYFGSDYHIQQIITNFTYNQMIQITDKSQCCGCTACASICVYDAITMQPDAMGFLYPAVDRDKCVDCGLCEKVCAFNDHYDTSLNLPQPDAYAARHKDMREVETSRSGAAFIAISDYVLENGGVDRIMLDNFSVEDTKKAVEIIGGRYETESSGGITIDTLRQYAECGVDYISVGALTHSVKSLDMSFKAV